MVTVQHRFISVDEFVRLPDPDMVTRELDEGWIVEHPPSDPAEDRCRAVIGEALRAFAEARGLGEVRAGTAFYLGPSPENGRDIVRTPHLAFLGFGTGPREERLVRVIRRVPDLAVEVVSRLQRPLPVLKKVHQYLDAGVQRVWLVDPAAETVVVLSPPFAMRELALGDDLTSGDVDFAEPGFAFPLDTLFARD